MFKTNPDYYKFQVQNKRFGQNIFALSTYCFKNSFLPYLSKKLEVSADPFILANKDF